MSNPFDVPDLELLAEEAAELQANAGNGLVCLVNIAPVLEDRWRAARAEFLKTYVAPDSHALPTDNEIIKSDPERMRLRSEAAANAHADKHGIAPGVVPADYKYQLGPTEDPRHVRTAREPFGKRFRPTVIVPPPDVCASGKRHRPWVLKHEREAKMFLRVFGPSDRGRLGHQDRGLREWTPELHREVILPYLKRVAAAQKTTSRGAAA